MVASLRKNNGLKLMLNHQIINTKLYLKTCDAHWIQQGWVLRV